MSTCKDCLHIDACSGFTPTDLDADVFDYCRKGNTDEIPDIEERCGSFKNKADYTEVVRCKDCKFYKKWSDRSIFCNKHICFLGMNVDSFCSYGERKESEVQGE